MARRLGVTIDCADPARLKRFWAAALGYVDQPPPDGFTSWIEHWRSIGIPESELEGADEEGNDAIVDPDGIGPRIWFQQVPEPKVVKNRLHLDLAFDRSEPRSTRQPKIDAEVRRLVDLGASVSRVSTSDGSDYYAVVMQDPEGNEFCVG